RLPQAEMTNNNDPNNETSQQVLKRVIKTRERALERRGHLNALLTPTEIKLDCQLDDASSSLLEQAVDKLGLSHRAFHRILKMARTIADMQAVDAIQTAHISEAISYRRLDRNY
ncbi:MAG: ATP-dependent protease, partial [Methylococcales bacterium]